MPVLKTFIFECISDAQTQIVIKSYLASIDAFHRLSFHVKDPSNFRLIQK
jgi:hypothetical protein